jgi:hypothetical protein
MDDPHPHDLGSCCACGCYGAQVRNILLIQRLAPVPGTGWGCVVCGLPSDGAIAVVCNDCLRLGRKINQVVSGYVSEKGRIPVHELREGVFCHREHLHARVARPRPYTQRGYWPN